MPDQIQTYVPTVDERMALFGDPRPVPPGQAKPRAADDVRRDRRVREAWQEAAAVGWMPYSVFSVLPEQQPAIGPIVGRYYALGAAAKGKYAKLHIDQPQIDMLTLGGEFSPKPVLPKALANDVVRAFEATSSVTPPLGCVIMLPDPDGTRELTPDEFAGMEESLLKWYRKLKRHTDALWAKHPGNHLVVSQAAIIAANAMRARGEIAQMPQWATESRDTSVEMDCPACGNTIKKTAKMCLHCKFELDPDFFRAYRTRRQSAVTSAPAVEGPQVEASRAPADDEFDVETDDNETGPEVESDPEPEPEPEPVAAAPAARRPIPPKRNGRKY